MSKVKHRDGWPALHSATSSGGCGAVVRLLVEKGMEIDAQERHGGTALQCQ